MNSGLEQVVTRSLPGVSTMLRSILKHKEIIEEGHLTLRGEGWAVKEDFLEMVTYEVRFEV